MTLRVVSLTIWLWTEHVTPLSFHVLISKIRELDKIKRLDKSAFAFSFLFFCLPFSLPPVFLFFLSMEKFSQMKKIISLGGGMREPWRVPVPGYCPFLRPGCKITLLGNLGYQPFWLGKLPADRWILSKYNDFTQFILFNPHKNAAGKVLWSPFYRCFLVTWKLVLDWVLGRLEF